MTLKETILCELETADDQLLEDLLQIIRLRKKTHLLIDRPITHYAESRSQFPQTLTNP